MLFCSFAYYLVSNMSDPAFSPFLEEKHYFFSNIKTVDGANARVLSKNYNFLFDHKKEIEQEFNHLYAILMKNREKREQFLLWCYYCCGMMEAFYISYDHPAKIKEYADFKKKLLSYLKPSIDLKKKEQQTFLKKLGKKLAEDMKDLATTPLSISKSRAQVGFLNVCRIYGTFLRLTLTSAFLAAQNALWIEKLNQLLGKQIDVDQIIKLLEAPSPILRALSVGFFLTRLIMNAGVILKHVFSSTERTPSLNLVSDLFKRHAQILNDVVWLVVNGLTNFPELSHLSMTACGVTTAGFLVFDAGLILWQLFLDWRDYLAKHTQYSRDYEYYSQQWEQAKATNALDANDYEEQCKVITEQLAQLEIEWQTKKATYLFNASAALLIAAGFTASMMVTGGFLVAGAFGLSLLGVAMYLTDTKFAAMMEAYFRYQQSEGDDSVAALAVFHQKLGDFFYTMSKNALFPAVMIVSLAVCWQAAVVLATFYAAAEIWRYCSTAKSLPDEVVLELESEVEPDLLQTSIPLLAY